MKKSILYISALLFIFSSCDTLPEPEMEVAATYPVSGDWWVTYKFDDGSGVIDDYYGVGYTQLQTMNTAANTKDSIWIDDSGHFWDFKVRSGLDLTSKTFGVVAGSDLQHDDDTSITNGQVIQLVDGDSIYMEIEWASDPGTIYQCSGRRVKGGASYEDDYKD
jgi:hypothetical protein